MSAAPQHDPIIQADILDLPAAAAYARVGEIVVRRWCAEGLPHVLVSGNLDRGQCELVVIREDMLAWLRTRCVRKQKPAEPPPSPRIQYPVASARPRRKPAAGPKDDLFPEIRT